MKMNPVVHFEIPASDRKRMSDFYSKVFGWNNKPLGADHHDYVLARTSDCDETGLPKERGMINGGFYKKVDDGSKPLQYPTVVIAVEDIKEHMKKVSAAGGRVLGDPWDIPGVGLYISILDSEGNRISMIQPYCLNP